MKGIDIKKINDNLYFMTLVDNYEVMMYTTYSNETRIFNETFKLSNIQDCSQYMVKNGTNCILSFNNEQYIFLVSIIDGNIKLDEDKNEINGLESREDFNYKYVGYYIKPLINLKSEEKLRNTKYFRDYDYIVNNLNHNINFPNDITDFDVNININKSIYNCDNDGGCVSIPCQ